ncbi:MAG: lysylphosphatidylglycerol synthase transmembrane domain-containing protein [Polyangiales bacterium]
MGKALPRTPFRIRDTLNVLFLLLGIGLFALLLVRLDAATIGEQLESIGWFVVPSVLAYVGNQLAATRAWQVLLRSAGQDPGYAAMLRVMWMGHAINALTPGGSVGEVAKTTFLSRRGVPTTETVASLIIYNIQNAFVIGCFNLVAALLCVIFLPTMRDATLPILAGSALSFAGIAVFFVVVSKSLAARTVRVLRRLPFLARWINESALHRAEQVDDSVRSILHGHRRAVVRAGLWIVLVRVMQVVEVGFLLIPIVPSDQLVLVALLTQVSSQLIVWIGAFVPSQVGVMAAGTAGVFKLANLDPASGFAVAVARRVRTVFGIAVGLGLGAHAQLHSIATKRDGTDASNRPTDGS